MFKQLKPQRSFGDSSLRCGLIKDLKTRYFESIFFGEMYCCGLIKDLKTRYWNGNRKAIINRCGLIKDLKTRYFEHRQLNLLTVVV